jgi:transposase
MSFSIELELEKIILATKCLKDTYVTKHTNSKYSLDLIIKEIMFFLKSGSSWNIFRSPINNKTLFWHYSRFVKNNVFLRLFEKIKNSYLKKYIATDNQIYIDSTTIFNKGGINKLGRNKFYKNKKCTKISLMTDSNGFPLSVLFMKGNYHDTHAFRKHIKDLKVMIPKNKVTVLADKAYSSKQNYELLEKNSIGHIIPPRKNMKLHETYQYDKEIYKKRIKIEHIFGRIKMRRGLIVDMISFCPIILDSFI